MNTSPRDMDLMRQALSLAANAVGLSDPNPRVGCVLLADDGRVIGRGWTQRVGGPHAEVVALRDAQANGESPRGGTAYVTLEPCAHFGRTPPCCQALIQAGVRRVVMALEDPFPLVAGRGAAALRAAGIEVTEGVLSDEARELNIGFLARVARGRPWVRLKVAASLDRRTALPCGRSRWITGAAARLDGQCWRRRAGAVVTGIGTVRADDPRLDVRDVETAQQPLRVIIDGRLSTPLDARILVPPGRVLVFAARQDAEREAALRAAGAQVELAPAGGDRVDLARVVRVLGQRPVNEIHVEAGARLNGAWLRSGLVDELLLYLPPTLVGPGLAIAELDTLPDLQQAPRLRIASVERVGEDLRLIARWATGVGDDAA